MINHAQLNLSLDPLYAAISVCDESAHNSEADLLLDLMMKELIQTPSSQTLKVKDKTSAHTVHLLLDAYQNRVQVNAEAWTVLEAEIMSDINTYDFSKQISLRSDKLKEKGFFIQHTPIKIKAVIDWLDLKFEVNPTICSFAYSPNARSYIKSFITSKTATRHYVKCDDRDINQNGLVFTIRLHDIRSRKDLLKITQLLARQYGADERQMTIAGIELSLDLYHAKSRGLLSALHKSVRYSHTADNFRLYKFTKGDTRNKFTPVPHSPFMLLKHFNKDWCMGVNRKDSPLCYRLYPKTTDSNKQRLPIDEHRLRIEVTLNSHRLKDIDCHIANLIDIIKLGFKALTFTKLSNDASTEDRAEYYQCIKPFGMGQLITSKSRNKRTLANGVKTHSVLNNHVSKSIFNLCRQF